MVDFYRMNRIIGVDPDGQTATVQAGVVWEKLDRELAKHGRTLRLYPTSYPASTVGGWLAQGGAKQMPRLMPNGTENLMPHMIQDVVPLVTQPLIDYLRGRSQTQSARH